MLRESESTLEERYHRWLEFIGEGHSEDKQQGFYAGFCESSVVPCERVVAGHVWLVEEVTSGGDVNVQSCYTTQVEAEKKREALLLNAATEKPWLYEVYVYRMVVQTGEER